MPPLLWTNVLVHSMTFSKLLHWRCPESFSVLSLFGQTPIPTIKGSITVTSWWTRWRRDCLLHRLFSRRPKKTSKLRNTGLCEGNSQGTGEFPTQRASNAENLFIWLRDHGSPWPTLNLPRLVPTGSWWYVVCLLVRCLMPTACNLDKLMAKLQMGTLSAISPMKAGQYRRFVF